MPTQHNHFGTCPICTETDFPGSEVTTWQYCTPGDSLQVPGDVRCGNCSGSSSLDLWVPSSRRDKVVLKIDPQPFQDILNGTKHYDMRRNDRNFTLGDRVILREYRLREDEYTEREIHCTIIHMTYGGRRGLPKGYCLFGIQAHVKADD